jgi:hypothetical protein
MRNRFNWNYLFITAGIAILAPYVLRRIVPLLNRGAENVSGRDVSIAGKDAVRDAADDFGVGGFSGTVNRAVGRVTDRLS